MSGRLDQMPGGDPSSNEVTRYLQSDDPILHDTAWWIVDHHPEWADELAGYFRTTVQQKLSDEDASQLTSRLARFAVAESIQKVMGSQLQNDTTPSAMRLTILNAMTSSRQKPIPATWSKPLLEQLSSRQAKNVDFPRALIADFP